LRPVIAHALSQTPKTGAQVAPTSRFVLVRSEEKACPAMPVKYKRKKPYINEVRIKHPSMSARIVVCRWVCLTQLCAGISMGIAWGGDGEVHYCGRGEVGQLGL